MLIKMLRAHSFARKTVAKVRIFPELDLNFL